MLGQKVSKIVLLTILTTLVGCKTNIESPPTTNSSPQLDNTVTETIVIGDVSGNATIKIERFQPLADYLATNLSEFDIGGGEVKIAPDLETMAAWLKSGEVDVYFDSPYPAMIVVNQSDAKPILRRWKKGHSNYHTVIFTMSDRGISTVADLQGKMVAFESIFSTTGYVLPLVHLIQANLKPVEKAVADDSVNQDQIGYVFSEEDENVVQWVISGKVDAGATDIHTFRKIPAETRAQMTIIAETEKLPRNLVLVSSEVKPELVEKLKDILLDIDQTPSGQEILDKFEKTVKFDEFPSQETIARMQQLYEQVQNQ